MATLYIDNRPFDVKEGKNLLETCLSLGIDLPYFCWHPAMGSVGACRQCAIKIYKDETDQTGRLIMACMEPMGKETRISVFHPDAQNFRKQVIEWLMTNHPHDCAVCDEGGSCHLQDMTVMTGHNYRRFEFPKRTYINQYLGPLINHEMNRCIQCYRCVRFYKDYAGGKDLDVYAAHNHVYFGRERDGVLESEFSGNLAEICPTGVFTDKTLKDHYTRKWDFTFAPSVCQHCSLGCNIIAGERYGELRQITARFNSMVNGYFICDRGRFGYEVANIPTRINQPLILNHNENIDPKYLLNYVGGILSSQKCSGIGSPRASVESNYALQQLVGRENFYSGVADNEHLINQTVLTILQSGVASPISLKEIEQHDAILILGEDLTNTAPMAALAVRQALQKNSFSYASQAINLAPWHDTALREYAQHHSNDLFILHPHATKLDELAKQVANLPPDEIVSYGIAVRSAIEETLIGNTPQRASADEIAQSLLMAERPLIIAGTSLMNEALLQTASDIALALKNKGKQVGIFFTLTQSNSLGLALMNPKPISQAFEAIENNQSEVLIVLENDLFRIYEETRLKDVFSRCKQIIVIDHTQSATSAKASVIIPAGIFSECDGTLINNEGRAQRFFQVFQPKNEWLKESWRWLHYCYALKNGIAIDENLSINQFQKQLTETLPQFKGLEQTAPSEDYRVYGQRIPRAPHRYSGRTAIQTNINVSEPKPLTDNDSPMTFTMEGFRGMAPSPLTPFFWSAGWNSVQSINKFQIEVGGPLHNEKPGIKILNTKENEPPKYYAPTINKLQIKDNERLVIPVYHLFGSEELSSKSIAVNELIPEPYIALNEYSLQKLNIKENEKLSFELNNKTYQLPVKVKPELANHIALIPAGLEQLGYIEFPGLIEIKVG
ncbi:NADH-quinone oxidoreductase subunit NuoG [Solitalea lacus]|uniref:NADH-quinone oxidoreductase subunit NuoG n=1 Tax=Solitalea lacus TaxID=2911172 RepID=UPI001EDC1163|nr:NADH-quinone oxidoreductase subunit NuoG [Solitalea lacus]UKJ07165.1 NADH-quinone oxidoreductase subunit NuoG [Solitalea lacus]